MHSASDKIEALCVLAYAHCYNVQAGGSEVRVCFKSS